jgi:hypothetical protein
MAFPVGIRQRRRLAMLLHVQLIVKWMSGCHMVYAIVNVAMVQLTVTVQSLYSPDGVESPALS